MGLGPFQTAAFMVGPYRNLTTLSAAVLSLHPQVQVLNHAGERILTQPGLDFTADPRREVLDAFLKAGFEASAGGQPGQFGGSIVLSHAFSEPAVKSAYVARYGRRAVKPDAQCFVWKESMRLQKRWTHRPDDLAALFSNCDEVRLLAPFRRPLDVALSSMKTRHCHLLTGKVEPSFEETLEAVLDAFAWVLRQRDRWPDRVFFYTQWEAGEDLFRRMAQFLGLTEDARWIEDAVRCFAVRSPIAASDDQFALFRELTPKKLAAWPQVAEMAIG
jgi:hypothetical protein